MARFVAIMGTVVGGAQRYRRLGAVMEINSIPRRFRYADVVDGVPQYLRCAWFLGGIWLWARSGEEKPQRPAL